MMFNDRRRTDVKLSFSDRAESYRLSLISCGVIHFQKLTRPEATGEAWRASTEAHG